MTTVQYFLYARKSTESEERQAMSIEAQIVELGEYALRENLHIIETFVESKSAKTPGRPVFNEMVSKIYASKTPIGILAWHPDRLARNSVDGGQVVYMVDTKKVVALRFPTFWFEPTPQGMFMLQVAFGQSKYYSDNLSENVKRGNRQKRRRGEHSGHPPIGYVNNPKLRNIEPDPEKAKVIQKLFHEFSLGGLNLHSGAKQLEDWGITCKKGNRMTPYMVHRILTKKAYLGLIVFKGECYEGSFKPLIDKETFDRVQMRLKNNGKKPRGSKIKLGFPYRGMFHCAECGGQITAQFAKGNGGHIRILPLLETNGPLFPALFKG